MVRGVGLRQELRMPSAPVPVAAALALALTVTGCAGRGSVEDDAVAEATTAFLAAAQGAPDRACDLLAPATLETVSSDGDCGTAMEEVTSSGGSGTGEPVVETWGRDAMVRWGEQTVFLARFDDGWRVTAAGCESRGEDLPFDCAVEGR